MPGSSRGKVTALLGRFGVSGNWFAQPKSFDSAQLETHCKMAAKQIPLLVSELARLGLAFELEVMGAAPERYLFHPGLGIHRQTLNQAGEVLIRAESVANALARAQLNPIDIERELRIISGVPWLDLIDSYRSPADVRLLPRAV